MSETQSTLKDVALEPTDKPTIDLVIIVAELTGTIEYLGSWKQYNMACQFAFETVERHVSGEEL